MKEQIFQYTNSEGHSFWYTQDFLDWFEDYWNNKKKAIKQWMRDNDCLYYIDHNINGMPILIYAKPEDLYTEEELLKQKFNDLIKEMEKKCTIKLHKYEKYLNVHKDPYEGFTLLNRTPKAGEIFMIDDITDKLWELGCICDNNDIQIVQLVKEDKDTGFIPPFEIRNINPKEHRFWALLAPETKCL